ncbi:MAG: hypothetical protein K0Q68_2414 [Moraxellaceae bacterium]|jgi:mono/diheme cytochrome c family protein|nr:hypothetical protein [Moraxellaceae bacterium]
MGRAPRITTGVIALGLWATGAALAAPDCPPTHQTPPAPAEYAALRNPLPASRAHLAAGKKLYRSDANCIACHGKRGDGTGVLAARLTPPPRDFTCPPVGAPVADGQLFWVIRNGSADTAMPPHPQLSDAQIWQLVLHVRQFRRQDAPSPQGPAR